MLNRIIIMGRLVADPVLKYTPQGTAVASFTVACERDYGEKGNKEVDFLNCVAWRNTAEFVAQYFSKGRMAVVEGRLQIRKWTDHDGVKRQLADIVVDSVYFADSRKQEASHEIAPAEGEWDNLGQEINLEDIPF